MNQVPDRWRYYTPADELERRWKLVCAEMNKQNIDCLVINAYDNMLGGYLRWFTDIAIADYPVTALFHRSGDITVIGHGGASGNSVPPPMKRGDWSTPAVAMMPTLFYTERYVPDIIIKNLKDSGCKKVGYVALTTINSNIYKYMTEELSGVEFVDATDFVDHIKAVKGPWEIEGIKMVSDLHDKLVMALPSIIRPDKYEYEVTNDIRRLGADLGSECVINVSIGADPNKPHKMLLPWQYRRLQNGDKMFCLIEFNGPGGQYSEALRTVVLGEPPQDYVTAAADAESCLKMLISMMKPGVKCSDLFKANNEYLTALGYFPEERLFGHGQGYDMVERPALVPAETMSLVENMHLCVHPGAVNEKVMGFACSNFLITKDGCEQITKAPNGLVVC